MDAEQSDLLIQGLKYHPVVIYSLSVLVVPKHSPKCSFICLEFYVALITVRVKSRPVVVWAEKTSTYSWSRFCTVNCRPSVSKYQLSQIGSRVLTRRLQRWEASVLPLCLHGPSQSAHAPLKLGWGDMEPIL